MTEQTHVYYSLLDHKSVKSGMQCVTLDLTEIDVANEHVNLLNLTVLKRLAEVCYN
jgi:hypothetical protein